MRISSIALGGTNAADFGETTTCGSSLAFGGNCGITATFIPFAAGTLNATISINDNAPDSPQTISLRGIGNALGVTPPGAWGANIGSQSGPLTHQTWFGVTVK